MDVLRSKNFSLACALLNGIFAFTSFLNGSYIMTLICTLFCGICYNNYKNS